MVALRKDPNDGNWGTVCFKMLCALLRSLEPFVLLLRTTGIRSAKPAIAGQRPLTLVGSKGFRR